MKTDGAYPVSVLGLHPPKNYSVNGFGNHSTAGFLFFEVNLNYFYTDPVRSEGDIDITKYERFMVRSELQVKKGHILYCEKKKGVPRSFEAWVNPQREQEYLAKLHAVIPAGDFYTLEAAKKTLMKLVFLTASKAI